MLDILELFQLMHKTIEMVCKVLESTGDILGNLMRARPWKECEAIIARPVLVSRTAAWFQLEGKGLSRDSV